MTEIPEWPRVSTYLTQGGKSIANTIFAAVAAVFRLGKSIALVRSLFETPKTVFVHIGAPLPFWAESDGLFRTRMAVFCGFLIFQYDR